MIIQYNVTHVDFRRTRRCCGIMHERTVNPDFPIYQEQNAVTVILQSRKRMACNLTIMTEAGSERCGINGATNV